MSATLPAVDVGPLRFEATPAGPGHGIVTAAELPLAGDWQLAARRPQGRVRPVEHNRRHTDPKGLMMRRALAPGSVCRPPSSSSRWLRHTSSRPRAPLRPAATSNHRVQRRVTAATDRRPAGDDPDPGRRHVLPSRQPKAGWRISITRGHAAAAGEGLRREDASRQASCRSRGRAGRFPDAYFDTFELLLGMPNTPGKTLYFKTVQRCIEGRRSLDRDPGQGRPARARFTGSRRSSS